MAFQFAQTDPIDLINSCEHINKGNHLILSTGDFGQRVRSATELNIPGRAYEKAYEWLDERFSIIALESTKDLTERDQPFLPYTVGSTSIISTNPSKQYLVNFAGAMGYPLLPPSHIRGETFIKALNGKFIGNPIGELKELQEKFIHLNSYSDFMQSSIFTLCPAGYGRWTFRLIEALENGSIPILISDGYILPFSDQIIWDKYIIQIKESDIWDIENIVLNMSLGDVYAKLQNIKKDKEIFQKRNVLQLTSQALLEKTKAK